MSYDPDMDTSSSSHTQLYVVIKSFKARLDDELTINEGDIVDLISDDSEFDDGWYMGKNLTTGKVGLYPKVFTQIQKDNISSKPSLLRSRSRRTTQNSPVSNVFGNSNTSKNNLYNDSQSIMNASNSSASSIPQTVVNDRNSNVNRYVNDIDIALRELNVKEHLAVSDTHVHVNEGLNVIGWTPAQVAEHFAQIVDDETASKFIIHKISGKILLELQLSHLKELDIDSFGTRYEIFREIEALRTSKPTSTPTEFSNQSQFSDSPTVNSSFDSNKQRFSYKQTPHFQNNDYSRFPRSTPPPLPLANSYETPNNRHSIIDEIQLNSRQNLSPSPSNPVIEEQFASPRRAPKPPSYPSPVANNPTKFGIRSPEKSKFGNDILPALSNQAHQRNSSTGNASSIYVDTASPSRRHSSIISDTLEPLMSKSKFLGRNQSSSNEDSKESISSLSVAIKPASDRRSVSAKEFQQILKNKDVTKRIHSDIPSISTNVTKVDQPNTSSPPALQSRSTFRNLVSNTRNSKSNTSAFQEGIRSITPDEALANADYSGWMFKRGNLTIGSWKHRFFTLHGTRLSYYVTTKDNREKGLIDITAHRVLPATEAEDKISAVYAASAGYGRFCFKLVPPAPGSRSGLTFTQQKVHYFAVETREEMRSWMSALMKATIELDESIPAISSCVTPTIPLQKAQELMAVARENARENFDNLQKLRIENKGFDITSDENSVDSPKSPINGMSTPYMMTSGILNSVSSGLNGSSTTLENTPARMSSVKSHAPVVTKLDAASGNNTDGVFEQPPSLTKSQSFSKRLRSIRRSNKD
ncbi:hypothetical protein CANINC_002803 [Pichia inconspicua]|uniref:Protein BOI2 n=1 Tax=Pichia inconspicua TaxID=52247 RepID=A0A4V4NFM1_9ASCO|nr:hypothetical protein CANINC_002803 [[Candida] inconspicua]